MADSSDAKTMPIFENLDRKNPFFNAVCLQNILDYLPMADNLSLKIAAVCLREQIDAFMNLRVIGQKVVMTNDDVVNLLLNTHGKQIVDKMGFLESDETIVKNVELHFGFHLRWMWMCDCYLAASEFYGSVLQMKNLTHLRLTGCQLYGYYALGTEKHERLQSIAYISCELDDIQLSFEFLAFTFPNLIELQLQHTKLNEWFDGEKEQVITLNIQALTLAYLKETESCFPFRDWSHLVLPKLTVFSWKEQMEDMIGMKKYLLPFMEGFSSTVQSITIKACGTGQPWCNLGTLGGLWFPHLNHFQVDCFELKRDQYAYNLPDESTEQIERIRRTPLMTKLLRRRPWQTFVFEWDSEATSELSESFSEDESDDMYG